MKIYRIYMVIGSIILILLCLFIPSWRDWCTGWAFNTIFLLDNTFALSEKVNPIVLWVLVLLLVGAFLGMMRAVFRYKLDKKIILISIVGIFLLIIVTVSISKPIDKGTSREFREETLWMQIEKDKTFSQTEKYLKEFPDGKYNSEARKIQENALWDSAVESKSSDIWKFFIDKFSTSDRVDKARTYHENALWRETKKINSTYSYRNYIEQYPNGKFTRKALAMLKSLEPETSQDINTENIDENGQAVNDDNTSNTGRIDYSDGRYYEGTVINGVPEGRGYEYFSDGTYLEGDWVNGKRQGTFVFHRNDGTTEIQEFENGNRTK